MYRTGDLGRIDAHGRLHYLGRCDTQVKLRGFRVELGEVESVLAAAPGVAVAAAAVHGTGGDQRLVGYVVARPGADPADQLLRARLAERLPGYMVPDVFVRLDELPLNRSGKIDRPRLPEPAAVRGRLDQVYAAPRSDTEERTAAAWARVLTLDRVGIHDNFFDLGGNSVRLMRVLATLREQYPDAGLTLVDLFRRPTVAALAAHLDQAAAPGHPLPESAAPGTRTGTRRERQTAAVRLRNRKGIRR